jgi:gas vesicle protein
MSNKKLIIGIAAGVAALAVIAVIAKRKGYLDGVIDKAEEFGEDIKERYNSVKETAKKKYEEIADKVKSNGEAAPASNTTTNPATA